MVMNSPDLLMLRVELTFDVIGLPFPADPMMLGHMITVGVMGIMTELNAVEASFAHTAATVRVAR